MNMPLNTLANTSDPIAQARYNMIEQQIRPWDVLDHDVLALLSVVRREDFVPTAYKGMAFMDMSIPLMGSPEEALRLGHCMLAPRVEARMLQDLEVKPTDRVLEIGTGSGYMAALLAHRAQSVVTLEIQPQLADMARNNLQATGIHNVDVLTQNGATQLPAGPFDVIVLSGSVAEVPGSVLALLAEGGRLGAIVGHDPMMRFTVIRRTDGKLATHSPWDTAAPRLEGFAEPSRFAF